jgi:hypothetical protein
MYNISSKFSKDIINNYKNKLNKKVDIHKYHADLHDLVHQKATEREDQRIAGIQRHIKRSSAKNISKDDTSKDDTFKDDTSKDDTSKDDNIVLESISYEEIPQLSRSTITPSTIDISKQGELAEINLLFKTLNKSNLLNSNEQEKKSLYEICKRNTNNNYQQQLENYCKGRPIITDNDFLLCGYQDSNTCTAGYEHYSTTSQDNLSGYYSENIILPLKPTVQNDCQDNVYVIPKYLSKKINSIDMLSSLCPHLNPKTLLLIHLESRIDPIINVINQCKHNNVKFFNNTGQDITLEIIKANPILLEKRLQGSKVKWILIIIFIFIILFIVYLYNRLY